MRKTEKYPPSSIWLIPANREISTQSFLAISSNFYCLCIAVNNHIPVNLQLCSNS